MDSDLSARLALLAGRGVKIVDPRQTFVDADVDPTRIWAGAVLYPGTRLHGARTFLGPGASVGREGPAVLYGAVLGENAAIASGYAEGAVLLRAAKVGANAHLRDGTLLEEEASTAHAVGLKQTVLLSFVTLGSLINFCDVLMAGGTSRDDHSEVGSGFIHFNFTPWGRRGDKATPSLVGDAVAGALLRQRRIFLGGAGGMVGPRNVGYGSVAAAGQVVRRDVPAGRLSLQGAPVLDEPLDGEPASRIAGIVRRNVEYLAQLRALQAWYRQVRIARAPQGHPSRVVAEEGLANLGACVDERIKRLESFLAERGRTLAPLGAPDEPPCPVALSADATEHVAWVRALTPADVTALGAWLEEVAARVRSKLV
jgi:hypothetical protein